MIVFITLAFSAFVGVMGLAVDYGFATYERRHMQKVVDAAALSGALDLTDAASYDKLRADVDTMAQRNGVAPGTSLNCALIDNNKNVVQNNCYTPTNDQTAGIRVSGGRQRETYFMRVLNVLNYPVNANSGAHLQRAYWSAGNSLFIVCGWQTKLGAGQSDPDGNDGKTDILYVYQGEYRAKPTLVGKRFLIHSPSVSDCDIHDNAFKGLADAEENDDINLLPATLRYLTGVRAGPTREAVRGIDGCAAGLYSDDVNDCIMLIPIAIASPSKPYLNTVLYLPFRVFETGANTHEGELVSTNYALSLDGPTAGNWRIGQSGPVSARLTN